MRSGGIKMWIFERFSAGHPVFERFTVRLNVFPRSRGRLPGLR
jgi:hypothetical protein